MCGIVSTTAPQGANPRAVETALKTMHHRGPDGTGVYTSASGTTCLGHARLSIVDLTHGAQPLFNEDRTVAAVVNGEFYNDAAIRAELEAKGHTFKTRSDSEILLHLYEEYGTACLTHLRGEFAFVLLDETRQKIFAARDRFGIKPLNYFHSGNTLHIASEAKALLALGVEARWDAYAFHHMATLQYLPQDRTCFEGIRQLKPGHMLEFQNNRLTLTRYWDINFPLQYNRPHLPEYVEACKAQLEEAVKLRMRSDVPLCCHLSGGLDSSSVLGTVQKFSSTPVDCFTVSFEEDVYNELDIAQETATFLGARLHVVPVTQTAIFDNLSDAVFMSEGLAINGHLSAKYLLSKAIKAAGFTVVLGGEGADEALAGYSHLRNDLLKAHTANPEALAHLFDNNPVTAGVHIAYGESLPLTAVQEALGYIPAFVEAKGAMGHRFRPLLTNPPATDFFAKLMHSLDIPGQLAGRSVVDQSSYLWTKLTLANYILRTLGDGTEMAHSVEGRVPFLDHHFFEFASGLPLESKIHAGLEKYVLREAAKDVLTDTVYKRQKQSFMAPPVTRFASSPMHTYMHDIFSSTSFQSFPYVNAQRVLALLDKLKSMPAVEQTATEGVLMLTLTAALLHQRYNMKG